MDTEQARRSGWIWRVSAGLERKGGRVQAVDPRDAISRALTSTMQSGQLLGEQMGIPVAVLDKAPGNMDTSFMVEGDGYRIEVQKLAAADGHPDLRSSVRNLKCCCCGSAFKGRQFFNQDTGWGLGDCCVDYAIPRVDDLQRTYGIHGVHYGV